MFSSPWKHISFCRMCPYLPKWSKPPGFCSLSIQFREALQIRAGLRAGELPSQSLFSGENSLAIKLEHPSWKCSRDFFPYPSSLHFQEVEFFWFSSFMASWHCWSLSGKFLLLGTDPGLTFPDPGVFWEASHFWFRVSGCAVLSENLRAFENIWKHWKNVRFWLLQDEISEFQFLI